MNLRGVDFAIPEYIYVIYDTTILQSPASATFLGDWLRLTLLQSPRSILLTLILHNFEPGSIKFRFPLRNGVLLQIYISENDYRNI
jgi:hypothetical protein